MPRRHKHDSPFSLWYDTAMLGLAAQQVMGLRLMKLSFGGRAAEKEMLRMVSEKSAAALEAGATMLSSGTAEQVVAGYRRRVRSNARRLSSQ